MIVDNYKFNTKKLAEYKRKAKAQYKLYEIWAKEKNYKKVAPDAGIYESDFSIHYKTNGLIRFKNYLIVIKETKKHIYL